jgi:hypothetical protein
VTLREVLLYSQQALKEALWPELVLLGYQPVAQDGFLYAKGSFPVLLVAHLDTFYSAEEDDAPSLEHSRNSAYDQTAPEEAQKKVICTSADGRYWMSPQGIGGDDRSGVYMVLQIIKEKRCHVLFCEDEERGRQGAKKFAQSGFISSLTGELNYIIGLDRRGSNDAVFYQCDNRAFISFICSNGFTLEHGSVSDISVIAPVVGVAAVNISSGYYEEHSLHEYIDMLVVERNITRILMLLADSQERYAYIKARPREYGRAPYS